MRKRSISLTFVQNNNCKKAKTGGKMVKNKGIFRFIKTRNGNIAFNRVVFIATVVVFHERTVRRIIYLKPPINISYFLAENRVVRRFLPDAVLL